MAESALPALLLRVGRRQVVRFEVRTAVGFAATPLGTSPLTSEVAEHAINRHDERPYHAIAFDSRRPSPAITHKLPFFFEYCK